MAFSTGDRVHLLEDKTYGNRTIPKGTCGTVASYSSLTETCTVKFDGNPFVRLVRASDLMIGCDQD